MVTVMLGAFGLARTMPEMLRLMIMLPSATTFRSTTLVQFASIMSSAVGSAMFATKQGIRAVAKGIRSTSNIVLSGNIISTHSAFFFFSRTSHHSKRERSGSLHVKSSTDQQRSRPVTVNKPFREKKLCSKACLKVNDTFDVIGGEENS